MTRPTHSQSAAADPGQSNWVAANAGSGKTHVLTQRVARLLLAGAEPDKILCLTYTKAAAAEMQTRLFKLLGAWAMESDQKLGVALGDLTGSDPVRDPDDLARARRLFARALETPGGLKIQTIHAFCDGLLRRFPLEACVSSRFDVLDDREAEALRAEIAESMGRAAEHGESDAYDRAANRLTEDGVGSLIDGVLAHRALLADGVDSLAARYGAHALRPMAQVLGDAWQQLDVSGAERFAHALCAHGSAPQQRIGEDLSAALDRNDVDAVIGCLTTQSGSPRKRKGFPVKAVLTAAPETDALADTLLGWAEDSVAELRIARSVARTADLNAFAAPYLDAYAAAKARRGLLDFDDLIDRSRTLLTRPDLGPWVRYKLDRGLDHILVDEAQDTAPIQWDVIEAIAREFFTGDSAGPSGRSIFVVGDEKQSIYSFQGADPLEFGKRRSAFRTWLDEMGTPLGRPDLQVSFRSAPAILDFVDRVFDGNRAAGLSAEHAAIVHEAHRSEAPGRIDLWDLVEAEDATDPPDPFDPVDKPPSGTAPEVLAGMVADAVSDLLASAVLPARDDKRPARSVRPRDILILVARRVPFAPMLTRALKSRGVPVAGADRLRLLDEIAVLDLLALAKVCLTPGDDLSLAALLRSPLCDVSEEALFTLAHGRSGTLWSRLMDSGHEAERAFLTDMADKVDFLRPYEFLERALIHHDGRRRLLARLGPEAEDPIDELLEQALGFERHRTPSLAGFIDWIEGGDFDVKREHDPTADVVRIMTVHGAKGLESPIVILPDTVRGQAPGRPSGGATLLTAAADGNTPATVLWAGPKTEDDPELAAARQDAEARADAENMRLAYVALTRAEDWLILAGAGKPDNAAKAHSWFGWLSETMASLPTTLIEQGVRYQTGAWPDAPTITGAPGDAVEAPLRPPPPVPTEARAQVRSPSTLFPYSDDGATASGRGWDAETARAFGTAVHLLLEVLPDLPAADHAAAAPVLLWRKVPDLDPAHHDLAYHEAAGILALPEAAPLFGPSSIAEMSITVPDGAMRMTGRVDRVAITDDRVWLADFKTDGVVPDAIEDVPDAYLAQLACYALAARAIWPGKPIVASLIWTRTPRIITLPDVWITEFGAREMAIESNDAPLMLGPSA